MAKILYQAGIPKLGAQAGTTAYWEKFISDLLDKYGIESIMISSTYRAPQQQALAMYNNVEALGVPSQLALYNAGGREIIKVYDAKKKAGYGMSDTLKAMVAKINELKWYGGHGRIDPDFICFDVPPQSIKDKGKFMAAFKSVTLGGKQKIIEPGNDPVYHIEITKGVQKAVQTVVEGGKTILPVIILIAVAFYYYTKQKGSL